MTSPKTPAQLRRAARVKVIASRRKMLGRLGDDEPPGGHVPSWSGAFTIPTDACGPCRAHVHYRCVGGDPLQEPLVDCPCDCGHFRNQMLMNARAWDDMARHVPWLIWKAVQRERLIAGGVNICGDTAKIRAAHRDGTL